MKRSSVPPGATASNASRRPRACPGRRRRRRSRDRREASRARRGSTPAETSITASAPLAARRARGARPRGRRPRSPSAPRARARRTASWPAGPSPTQSSDWPRREPRAAKRLDDRGERLDEARLLVGDAVGDPGRVAREVARRDPDELGHAARIQPRRAPVGAVDVTSGGAGRAGEAGRVVVRRHAIARAKSVTPSPSATISPATSWPRIEPALRRTYQSSRSEPQMPETRVRRSASPGPIRGSGSSTTSTEPSASMRTAFMRRDYGSGEGPEALCVDPGDPGDRPEKPVDLVLRRVAGATGADDAVRRVAQALDDSQGVEVAAREVQPAPTQGLGHLVRGASGDHERERRRARRGRRRPVDA